MKLRIALVLVPLLMLAYPAFAGKLIEGSGKTSEQACWNYNRNANRHAYDRDSCWGRCKVERTTQSNGIYKYVFNNPNHGGSCPKAKYDGGSGFSDPEFVRRFPPPDGIPNPYPPQQSPPGGQVGFIVERGVPRENYATLRLWNLSNKPVTFYCTILLSPGGPTHTIEEVTLQPSAVFHKEYHRWESTSWDGICNSV